MARFETRCFPHSDCRFAERVAEIVERLEDHADDARHVAGGLRDELMAEYPLLRIRLQEPLAAHGPGPVVVYVYRDGHPLDRPVDGPGTMRVRDPREALFLRAAASVARSEELLRRSWAMAVEWRSRAA